MNVDEIRALREYYDTSLYSNVRKEQETDRLYIEDTFPVPEVHDPHQLYRSGIGDRIVNAPAENIITARPQVFFHPRKDNSTTAESALKLSRLINQEWLPLLQKQNPNIFKEFIKNLLGRGEAFFKIVHNDKWTSQKDGLPVWFMVPDSMVVYASPEENMEGVPDKVIVWYGISQFKDLIPKYPFLQDKEGKTEMVNWLEYYDAKQRYVELGGQAITKAGVQSNIYGFTPFVRKYSGFGRRSPDGELASLIVSDIRRSRDLLREECATRSNIASIEYLFAHRPHTFIGRGLTAEQIRDSISYGAYDINAVDADPNAIKIEKLDIVPSPETYKHLANIVSELNQRHPVIMSGFPWGTSGRQQDLTELAAMRRYDSVVESLEHAFATALTKALFLCSKLPGYLPNGISKKDLAIEYDIEVKLKAKDPIEEDRKITMGDRLWAGGKGSISLHTFHTQYQGMTEDESKREVARMLADQITIFNPEVAAVMGMVAAEETGMEQWLEKARMRREQMEETKGMREEMPKTSQERIKGEVQTPQGYEEAVPRGARQSPERYTRGG